MDKIILFDGICNLCNASVNFIIDHDPKKQFQFVSLQSSFAQDLISDETKNYQLYTQKGLFSLNSEIRKELSELNSIVYFENGILFTKSDAVFRIVAQLDGFYKLLAFAKILPASFRNFLYDYIAKNRYLWFGKSDSCRMPNSKLSA